VPPLDLGENLAHGIDQEVARAVRERREVFPLHVGDPDLETPVGIREAAAKAMAEGRTHYAPPQGLARLRAAIVEHWASRHGVPATAEEVVVLPAKLALYGILVASLDPGEEVLFADPSYFFEEPTRLARGVPSRFPLREDHSLDLDGLAEAITPRTRVVALVTPGNPTGRRLKKDELRAVGEIVKGRGITVLSDEAYSELVYDGSHVSTASVVPPEVSVATVGSFSKTYAMSGWRAGFAIAPKELAVRLVRVVEHTITCIPPFVQEACRWALENGERDGARLRGVLQERRDQLLGRLDDLPGLSYVPPDSAIYVFPRYEVRLSSAEFARRLLAEEGVAVAPGAAFGPRGEGHVRVAYSLPPERLDQAADRLGSFLERLGASRG
jgi:aspartate aminotransferase